MAEAAARAAEAAAANLSGGLSIKPPKPLTFGKDMATEWKMFKQQYNWFEIATQLIRKPAEIQAATFMSVMGPEAINIYNTFNLTAAEQIDVTAIRTAFENYFTPNLNVTYERYIFNRIKQESGEQFEDFLTKIKTQSSKCEFGILNDSLIKDKVVIGINSDAIREKLLTENNLDLNTAAKICRSSEISSQQIADMQIHDSTKIDAVNTEKVDTIFFLQTLWRKA